MALQYLAAFARRPAKNYLNNIKLSLLLMICLPLITEAKATYDSLFHQSYAIRSVYFDRVVTPDLLKLSVTDHLKELDALQQRAKKEGDYPAELEIVIGRYQFKDDSNLLNLDQKLIDLEALLRGLDQEKYPEYAAVLMDYLAQNYFGKSIITR